MGKCYDDIFELDRVTCSNGTHTHVGVEYVVCLRVVWLLKSSLLSRITQKCCYSKTGIIHASLVSISTNFSSVDTSIRLDLCPNILGPYYDQFESSNTFPQRGNVDQDSLCKEARHDLDDTTDVFFLSTNATDYRLPILNFTHSSSLQGFASST